MYDTLTEQARYFSTNNMWLKNRMEYSSRFKDAKDENKNYYGWLNDNAVTDSVTAAERAKIYDENNARIAEIDEEMKTVGRQWNGTGGIPVFTGWGNKAKYKELKAEKENLEAENRRYDRTQGKTDSNYKLTQNADFKQNSYAGENKNPSHEDVLKWYNDYTMSGGSWGASQDILDMMPVVDDELSLYDTTKNIEWNDVTSNENDAYYTNYIKGKQNAWEFLTDEERGIYYYLRNTKGKEAGDEFLESMATVLGKRATDEIARNAHDIPQELKHTVAEFLLPFTEDSSVFGKAKDDVLSLERYVRMNDLLTDIYNATEGDSADGAALNERYRSLAGNLDGDLVRDFGEMRRTMAGKRLSQLSLDELQTVNKIVVNIANMVKQGRETFINGKKESLDEIGRETVNELTSRRQRRKHLKPVDWAIDLMNDKETTPIYFFGEKLGGFFGQIYRDIRDAQDKWYVRCAEAQRSIEDLQDKYNFKKWSGKADKGVTFTLDDGGTVTLTKEQILSIYATAKRERNGGNNTTHVFDGGIVVDDELRRGLKDKICRRSCRRHYRYELPHSRYGRIQRRHGNPDR